MVYWTSINTSCKKEIFWISETIKKIHIQQNWCDPATELISIFLSSYFYYYTNSFGIHCFNELKWFIGHKLIHPVRNKSFGLLKTSKKQIQIQQKWCEPATELIFIFLSLYLYSYMNFFGTYCFNELKMVYWTSFNTSYKKEIFWIRETIKIANSYSAKMV
jgi:hypothetical protein